MKMPPHDQRTGDTLKGYLPYELEVSTRGVARVFL